MANIPREFAGYTIVGERGQGETGTVFEARQSAQGFVRRVTIKVYPDAPEGSLPLWETRILARLEHPGIARLLDAGWTPARQRYLTTEFVEGVPCLEYAETQSLDPAARLKLFLQVCEAVHYANRALVVHCDIKPANILVTSEGVVKLLDFGIARLLSDSAHVPASVATDVFALGGLLRELMPAKLAGDVALIADKAQHALPEERYASVADLAEDVQRHLERRPIAARPQTLLYRASQFVARHRQATAAAAAVFLLILAGTAYALQQRKLAELRFAEIRGLANHVLFDLHDEIAKLPGSLAARHTLVSRGVQYLDGLGRSAGGDTGLQLEVAKGLLRLADIEGVSNEPSLGDSGKAVNRLDQAERLVRAVVARNPGDLTANRALYLALETKAAAQTLRGGDEAALTAQDLLRLAQRNAAQASGNEDVQDELAHAYSIVASAYNQSTKFGGQAVASAQKSVAEWTRLQNAKPDSVLRKRELARAYNFLAGAHLRATEREPARQAALNAYRMHKELAKVPGEEVEHMLASDVGMVAVVSAQLQRYAEAIPMFEEQLQLREAMYRRDPSNYNALHGVGSTLGRIGTAYVYMNQPEKGLPYLERALATQRIVYGKDPDNVNSSREMLWVLSDLADTHRDLKQREPMCRRAAEAAVMMKGAVARTRESGIDVSKKKVVRKILAECGLKE